MHGWGGWIRTTEYGIQSPAPYRLATPQDHLEIWKCGNVERRLDFQITRFPNFQIALWAPPDRPELISLADPAPSGNPSSCLGVPVRHPDPSATHGRLEDLDGRTATARLRRSEEHTSELQSQSNLV